MDAHTNARDKVALNKLDEVVIGATHLMFPLDKIVEAFLGASDACEDQCSPEVHAKLWMQAGIAFGSGKNDLESAQCAFEIALAWDPKVVLDEAFASDAVKALFARVRHDVCGK